jgi:uncharacterized protein YicC (UPF0701 family)
VRRLSEFGEGNVNSEIAKNVTCVIGRSDVIFEYLRLKDHVHNSVHVCVSEKWLKTEFDY